MSDETGAKLFRDKNSYILDWLSSEGADAAASAEKECPEQRIEFLISMLTRDIVDDNVLRFKPGKK